MQGVGVVEESGILRDIALFDENRVLSGRSLGVFWVQK